MTYRPVDPTSDPVAFRLLKLVERVDQLERQLGVLAAKGGTYLQDATVIAFTGGSSICTVQYADGTTASLRYMGWYTPSTSAPNNAVTVAISPGGSVVLGRRGP